MSRKVVAITVAVIVLSLTGWLLYKTARRIGQQQVAAQKVQQLPDLTLHDMDSVAYSVRRLAPGQPTVLIYFNSVCEHCQYEAQAIRERADAFRQATIVLISSESLPPIRAFAVKYGLNKCSNIHFASLSFGDVVRTFGSVSVPQVFIYNRQQQLVKQFKGETKTDAILQYLK